eukprot:4950998-Alexandrium_andersonii.AAC.1
MQLHMIRSSHTCGMQLAGSLSAFVPASRRNLRCSDNAPKRRRARDRLRWRGQRDSVQDPERL